MNNFDFEQSIIEIEEKLDYAKKDGTNVEEIAELENALNKKKIEVYKNLTAWDKVRIARLNERPTSLDYIEKIFDEFVELHGDRQFKDDKAIIGGIATLNGKTFTVIGEQKGRNTKENLFRNFGMPNPEGYRKALRLMKQAEKFNRPIITFIDTPGAYCGLGAEERGQGEAIAKNLLEMSRLKVPVICVVIGEGSSGGALAVGVGDKILMLEHAVYSILSPEGFASILWKDGTRAKEASEVMKMTAQDLYELNIIDEIIEEPLGGAHKDVEFAAMSIKKSILVEYDKLSKMDESKLLENRYNKFRKLGEFKII